MVLVAQVTAAGHRAPIQPHPKSSLLKERELCAYRINGHNIAAKLVTRVRRPQEARKCLWKDWQLLA